MKGLACWLSSTVAVGKRDGVEWSLSLNARRIRFEAFSRLSIIAKPAEGPLNEWRVREGRVEKHPAQERNQNFNGLQ